MFRITQVLEDSSLRLILVMSKKSCFLGVHCCSHVVPGLSASVRMSMSWLQLGLQDSALRQRSTLSAWACLACVLAINLRCQEGGSLKRGPCRDAADGKGQAKPIYGQYKPCQEAAFRVFRIFTSTRNHKTNFPPSLLPTILLSSRASCSLPFFSDYSLFFSLQPVLEKTTFNFFWFEQNIVTR